VECLLRPDAAAPGRGDFEEAYQQAAGLFETALTIPGIDRWTFDLAGSSSPTAHGCGRAPTVSLAHLTAALKTFERLDSQSLPSTGSGGSPE
jgi:hypothetical protein